MNRRQFLRALAAAGASIALPVAISEASETQIDQAWNVLVKEPWYFEVNESGTIEVAGLPPPTKWSDVYDLTPFRPRTPEDLIEQVEIIQPLADHFQGLVRDEVDEIAFQIDEIETEISHGDQEDEPQPDLAGLARERDRLRERLERISDPDTGWQDWLHLEGQGGVDRLWAVAQEWKDEAIDWDYQECLPVDWSAQGQAYRFFQQVDRDTLAELSVRIVEGDCPGSDYFAAELRSGIEAANQAAGRLKLPFRFRVA